MTKLSQAFTSIAFKLLSANGALKQRHLQQLSLCGIPIEDMPPILRTIRSVNSWQQRWYNEGERFEQMGNELKVLPTKRATYYKTASSMYYMADILHLPSHPDHNMLTQKMVAAYHCFGTQSKMFTPKVLWYKKTPIHCNFYHPLPGSNRPVIIMIPPLGSVKEQIDFQVMPFYDAGYAVLTVDLPGVGQSPGPMPLDAQCIIQELITMMCQDDSIDTSNITMMGLSLGAYWSMKTAAIDDRINGVIGISTPAISGKYWNRIPKHYWEYFQSVFQTTSLLKTRHVAEQLSLFGVMDKIKCPILLFHGQKDNVCQPNTMELFHQETKLAPMTIQLYPNSGHCCLDKIRQEVLPFSLKWLQKHCPLPTNAYQNHTA